MFVLKMQLFKRRFFCVKDFKPPKKPFKRMSYIEGIQYLKEHNITKDDGTFYEFGDVRPMLVYFYEYK